MKHVWITSLLLIGMLAGCTTPTDPGDDAPTNDSLEVDSITPGTWHVNGRPDRAVFWVHNGGDTPVSGQWSAHLAGGEPLPDGWELTFDPPMHELEPNGTLKGRTYPDWAHTVATIELPDDANGTHQLEISFAGTATTIDAIIAAPVRVADYGDNVNVRTVGTLERNGEEFWTGNFPTQAGTGSAVPGYRDGLLGVASGETVALIVPPAFAYGYEPTSSHQLADETLRFTIDFEWN